MDHYQATLQLDLSDRGAVDAVDAGKALIAWATTIHNASVVIDPTSPIFVDLVGTEAACLRLHAILRSVESGLSRVENALSPYPRIRSFLALNVFALPGAVIAGTMGGGLVELVKTEFQDQPTVVQQEAKQAAKRLAVSPVVTNDVQQFYQTVDQARGVSGVTIYERDPSHPMVSVPRSQFAERGGLWSPQSGDMARRPKSAVWDVIVTHPAIISKPRIWRFRRDGLPFKAKLADPYFLAAIKNRTLPMQVAEGALMRVQVEFFEVLNGQEWEADPRTFVISKVLWPAPLPTPIAAPLLTIIDHEEPSERPYKG